MIKRLVVEAEVVASELVYKNPAYLKHHLADFVGKVWVRIERQTSKRSNKQNRLYWGWLDIIADDTGNSRDDLHRYFKGKHLPRRYITVGDTEVALAGSTAILSVGEMVEYMMKVEQEALELGIELPKTFEEWERHFGY